MDDRTEDVWYYIQDAIKGKISRKEAEKKISELCKKYGEDAFYDYVPNLKAAAAYGLYERNERKKNNDANQADEDKKKISVPGIASAGLLGNAVRKTVRDI